MFAQLRTAILMIVVLTVITGLAYPLAMTGIARVVFPDKADGSLIERDGEVIGSELIGQSFVDADTGQTLPGFFRGRPSAAGALEDGTIISGGSNYGPTNQLLIDRVNADVAIIREENGLAADAEIPVDLVTTSGSGLDPHISPASAEIQIARVARERGIGEDQVRSLVEEHTEGRTLGVLGEPRVHVLKLNLALDDLA
ncbi:MAG: potassium-transporting ATPase subunit KdpC [Thermomicrobiales bacterium]